MKESVPALYKEFWILQKTIQISLNGVRATFGNADAEKAGAKTKGGNGVGVNETGRLEAIVNQILE